MFKKFVSVILVGLLINLMAVSFAYADSKTEKEARFAEKVKTGVAKIGTGKAAKIQVKLKDGTKLKGFVSEINENSFVVADEKTGMTTEIPYPNARQIKGNNLSTGAKVAIGLGILAAVLAIWLIFENYG
jgi:hypothetical protein